MGESDPEGLRGGPPRVQSLSPAPTPAARRGQLRLRVASARNGTAGQARSCRSGSLTQGSHPVPKSCCPPHTLASILKTLPTRPHGAAAHPTRRQRREGTTYESPVARPLSWSTPARSGMRRARVMLDSRSSPTTPIGPASSRSSAGSCLRCGGGSTRGC